MIEMVVRNVTSPRQIDGLIDECVHQVCNDYGIFFITDAIRRVLLLEGKFLFGERLRFVFTKKDLESFLRSEYEMTECIETGSGEIAPNWEAENCD